MPDHLHGIVIFPERFEIQKMIREWKRWLTRQYQFAWQDGFFEHRLRSQDSAVEKAEYIRMNPVRAGLVENADSWPFQRDWKNNSR
jgi:putative transposase